jgi:hypothetical protein
MTLVVALLIGTIALVQEQKPLLLASRVLENLRIT